MTFIAAVVQLTSTDDPDTSLRSAEDLIDTAAGRGASLVVLPENVSFMGTEEAKLKIAEPLSGPSFARLARKAEQHRLWLLAGTLPERGQTGQRAFNTSVLFSPDGARAATYRKIHLFDIALGKGANHMESNSVEPGSEIVVHETPFAKIGLSVCYDLRFPTLYRSMVRKGAEVFTVPAAFTVPTGRDHWEVLLRARAIENQCFVLAAGQVGQNTPSRETYGRSMIVDPWGNMLARCPDRPSIAIAEIDIEFLHNLRGRLPCLDHERSDIYG